MAVSFVSSETLESTMSWSAQVTHRIQALAPCPFGRLPRRRRACPSAALDERFWRLRLKHRNEDVTPGDLLPASNPRRSRCARPVPPQDGGPEPPPGAQKSVDLVRGRRRRRALNPRLTAS